ncbi:MAG: 4-(cytidine 5'-diphospho)-2-C-methyl-D-erythritol kinase [Acidimicrobiales bacterium]
MNIKVLAPAKLTLELRVTGTRPDGYHLIDAEMVSLDLCDEIEISQGDGLEIVEAGSGLAVESDGTNLVSRALRMVGRKAHVKVTKAIPAGAGLGGGSSDAAAILAWADMTDEVAASSLGADVAFCLVGGRARVGGIGEVVSPLPFRRQVFTLLTPPIGVSTPVVYRKWDQMGEPRGLNGNDLEPAALAAFPELAHWRDALAEVCGVQPRLAGSGGTWYVEGSHELVHRGVRSVVASTVRAGYGREKAGQTP